MKLFKFLRRKSKASEPTEPVFVLPPCSHTWKDFPWYIKASYDVDSDTGSVKIYEPYVCVHCKERKDVLLSETKRCNTTWNDFLKYVASYRDEYEEIKPLAIVEDMINDFVYVDRDKLDIIEKMRGNFDLKI